MSITLVPMSNTKLKNVLKVKLEFMHGDADAYTNKEFQVTIPSDSNKELLIGKIMNAASTALELMDEDTNYGVSPFVMTSDDDWNSTNVDEETGIPLVGAKLHFVHTVKHKYGNEHKINIGTVVSANEDIVTLEFNGTTYEVPHDEEHIAPETAIAIHQDGNECQFTIDGITVNVESEGDCTNDGQTSAQASFDEVYYYDENGNKFDVIGY